MNVLPDLAITKNSLNQLMEQVGIYEFRFSIRLLYLIPVCIAGAYAAQIGVPESVLLSVDDITDLDLLENIRAVPQDLATRDRLPSHVTCHFSPCIP